MAAITPMNSSSWGATTTTIPNWSSSSTTYYQYGGYPQVWYGSSPAPAQPVSRLKAAEPPTEIELLRRRIKEVTDLAWV